MDNSTEKLPENASEILAQLKHDFSDANDSALTELKKEFGDMVNSVTGAASAENTGLE